MSKAPVLFASYEVYFDTGRVCGGERWDVTLMLCRMLSPEADQTASAGRAREPRLAPVQDIFLITKWE